MIIHGWLYSDIEEKMYQRDITNHDWLLANGLGLIDCIFVFSNKIRTKRILQYQIREKN